MYVRDCTKLGIELYLMLPYMLREEKTEELLQPTDPKKTGIRGFLVHNLEQYALLKKAGMQECAVLNASMSAWNHRGILLFDRLGIEGDTVPAGIKRTGDRENAAIRAAKWWFYGHAVLMISAQCVKKNLDTRQKADSPAFSARPL